MQKKFGTMTPEDEDESASFSNFFASNFTSTNFTDITETVEHKPAEIKNVKEEINHSPEKKHENGLDQQSMFVMPMDVDEVQSMEVNQLESNKKEPTESKDTELRNVSENLQIMFYAFIYATFKTSRFYLRAL